MDSLESQAIVTTNSLVEIANLLSRLKAEFPPDQIKQRKGPTKKIGNKFVKTTLKYIPTTYVVGRLDDVFPLSWSWENKDCKVYTGTKRVFNNEQHDYESGQETQVEHIAVLGRLTIILPNGQSVYRDGWGGSELLKGSQAGDGFKIAASNAFKKAALNFGVGLYLAVEGLEEEDSVEKEQVNSKKTVKSTKTKNPFRK